MKRGNRFQKFGFTDLTQILGMTIRFIDDDQGLQNIVSLSKDLNEILREEVLKQSLMRANTDQIERKRKELWL